MKEFKGTKGEWKLNRQYSDEHGKILFITIVDEDNQIVAEAKGNEVVNAECMANAQLIAAAPETLEALQCVFEHAKVIINENHPDYKKAVKAINKALGL